MPRLLWVPPEPYDLARTLRVLRHGGGDPACRREADGTWWRTCRTPQGPVTLKITEHVSPTDGTVIAGDAWGPEPPGRWKPSQPCSAPTTTPPLLSRATGSSPKPIADTQACASRAPAWSWNQSCPPCWSSASPPAAPTTPGGASSPATENSHPGPPQRGCASCPLRRCGGSWEWHRAGVDRARATAILRACQHAPRLEEAAAMLLPAAADRLQLIPGIGPWTAAETLQRALGAPDALTLGDLHLPVQIGYALTGRRDGTDELMLQLLAPYTGQRHRAARLILLSGPLPNRRAHRAPNSRISYL